MKIMISRPVWAIEEIQVGLGYITTLCLKKTKDKQERKQK
jgi:hypothetical protein